MEWSACGEGKPMEFGSEKTLAIIRERIRDADSTELYTLLDGIVRRDAGICLARYGLRPEDREDIVQDACLKAFRGLVRFVLTAADKTVGERNSWLKTIVVNAAKDFLRAKKRSAGIAVLNIDDGNLDIPDGRQVPDRDLEQREALYDALGRLLRLNTSADKLVAFLLGVATARGENLRTAQISQALEGRTLRECAESVLAALERELGHPVPPELKERLWERIRPAQDQPFSLSARRISDSSNWIRNKLRAED